MHIGSSAVAAGDSHVAVTPQNIARTRLADGYHSSSTSHLSLALMRQFNAKLTICPRDQAGAVERIRSLGAPNVRATDTRASVGIRSAVVSRRATAARIDDGAPTAAAASATTLVAALIAATALVAAIVASAALVATAVTAGSRSCSFRLCLRLGSRCGSGRSLLLLKQGTRLFVEGVHKVGGVLHLDLNLVVNLFAFRGLLGSDLLLAGKFVFGSLKLLTSRFGLVNQIGVVALIWFSSSQF